VALSLKRSPQIVSEPIGQQQTEKNENQGLKTNGRSTKYSPGFYLNTLIPKGVLNVFRRDVFGEKTPRGPKEKVIESEQLKFQGPVVPKSKQENPKKTKTTATTPKNQLQIKIHKFYPSL